MFGRILRILRLLETRLRSFIIDRLCLRFTRLLFSIACPQSRAEGQRFSGATLQGPGLLARSPFLFRSHK